MLVTYRATMQIGLSEETLTLNLPDWMDDVDVATEFNTESMDVYGVNGVILQVEAV